MSVNITVNGKLTRYRSDAEHIKKELENERRKQRIQQVRIESKKIAKKIRDDVAEERERQLRRLEAVKAQELDCWREHMLAHKNHDYRNAIFQVGTAHAAAKAENESKALKESQQQASKPASYKEFRSKFKNRSCKNDENQQNKTNVEKSSGVLKKCAACAQCGKGTNNMKKSENVTKIVGSINTCCCRHIEDTNMVSSSDSVSSLLESTSSITCSSDEDEAKSTKATQTSIKSTPTILQRTPAVILDVEVDSNDSITVTAPCELKDKHVENNRQFDSIIRISPRKNQPKVQTKTGNTNKLTHKDTANIASSSKPVKFFSQVSDLLQRNETVQNVLSTKDSSSSIDVVPCVPNTTPKSLTPQKSPRKNSISTKSSSKSTAATVICGSSSSGRVQFYDYNNKFAKNYAHPDENVQFRSSETITQPNAMEQAGIEKQLREAREQEIEKLRKKSEERGQKALEREQVRRDCNKLTEKLDALTRQYPQLIPNDNNLHAKHHYEDIAARNELKMNTAIEEILMRPAIITCPQVNVEQQPAVSTAQVKPSTTNVINLATPNSSVDNTHSSDSCCSIILGYVDNQSKQLRSDLNKCETAPGQNLQKAEKLRNLLKRIEQLRLMLENELKNGTSTETAANVQQVIDSVSGLRKEREDILIRDLENAQAAPSHKPNLQNKEKLLEQKIREIYELQKQSKNEEKPTTSADQVKKTRQLQSDKPLEIIIKVKGETVCSSKIKSKTKPTKSPRKLSTLAYSPTIKKLAKKPTPVPAPANTKPKSQVNLLQRQNSYDSNSTSYRSLPSRLNNNVDGIVHQIEQDAANNATTRTNTEQVKLTTRNTRLSPLIAHYVQRLLGMSRNSITALGVSSSDIETPTSSIINTTSNQVPCNNEQKADDDELAMTQERLERVKKFVEENRSFINELEDSLRTQSNISLESSMRAFEEIWKQRLRCDDKKIKNVKSKNAATTQAQLQSRQQKTAAETNKQHVDKNSKQSKATKTINDLQQHAIDVQRTNDEENIREVKRKLQQEKNASRQPVQKSATVPRQSQETPAEETQIERYAHLTNNCTQRIAELTQLINKVRIEKQRLLEITLSSVSENGRNSTEYMELPNGQKTRIHEVYGKIDSSGSKNNDSDGDETTQSKLLDSNLVNELVSSSTEVLPAHATPLEKHKNIGTSRDSGISMSRPVTSQEQHIDANEPHSLSSSTQNSSQRKPSIRPPPPPTLRRFSPQLLEDELVHELSTILEVDTPGTSRLLQQATTTATSTTLQSTNIPQSRAPLAFPSFEEYVQKINLDVTQLNSEQSMRVQQEFNELIAALKEADANNALCYDEFPSLNTYLQNITAAHDQTTIDGQQKSPETIEDLLNCLRLANLTIKSFPTQKEYMKRLTTNTPEEELNTISTESLENISDTTESINIEDELRRRNILKHSFRRESAVVAEKLFTTSESGNNENKPYVATHSQKAAVESGIEKLSTSDNLSGDLERDLRGVGINWPTTMRRKTKETEAFSSTTSSNTVSAKQQAISRSHSAKAQHNTSRQRRNDDDSDLTEHGRALNLREFLTKELLKHANTSYSSSGTDDSLRSHFFHSIIGSLTPSGTPRTNALASTNGVGATSNNLERQKTSTPVPLHSTQSRTLRSSENESSTSTTQLFSGESRISSVHFQEYSSTTHYRNTRDNSDNAEPKRKSK